MKRIVVGGQIDKQVLADLIQQHGADQVNVEIKSDLDAAMAIKNGQADYYFGACNTGGGGALAMAIALLGASNCVTVGMPGKILSDDEIIAHIKEGRKAFGFTPQDANHVIPLIISRILTEE